MDLKNIEVGKKFNELVGSKRNVEIATNGNDDFLIRGKLRNVLLAVHDLAYGGLKLKGEISYPTGCRYCDGKHSAIVGK